jgi:transcriptional regulator with XRE-family HTH domain
MNRLQERRMVLGLPQPQVSARLKETEPRADVGMVSRYEKGVCLPTPDQLKALEDVLGASRTELYDAEDLDLLGALPTAARPARRRPHRPPHPPGASASVTASAASSRQACRTICSRCAGIRPGKAGMT